MQMKFSIHLYSGRARRTEVLWYDSLLLIGRLLQAARPEPLKDSYATGSFVTSRAQRHYGYMACTRRRVQRDRTKSTQ